MQTTAKAVVLNGASNEPIEWTPEDQAYFELCINSITELQSSYDC